MPCCEYINCVLDNEKERKQVNYSPFFLCVLRKQDRAITGDMDKKIAEYLPNYYGGAYKLETSENENQDMPGFVQEYTERIRTSNEEQGKNGVYPYTAAHSSSTSSNVIFLAGSWKRSK